MYARENVKIFIFLNAQRQPQITWWFPFWKPNLSRGPGFLKIQIVFKGYCDWRIRVRIATTLCVNYLSFVRHNLCDSVCQTSASKLVFIYNHKLQNLLQFVPRVTQYPDYPFKIRRVLCLPHNPLFCPRSVLICFVRSVQSLATTALHRRWILKCDHIAFIFNSDLAVAQAVIHRPLIVDQDSITGLFMWDVVDKLHWDTLFSFSPIFVLRF
jgi:hypothetical protein